MQILPILKQFYFHLQYFSTADIDIFICALVHCALQQCRCFACYIGTPVRKHLQLFSWLRGTVVERWSLISTRGAVMKNRQGLVSRTRARTRSLENTNKEYNHGRCGGVVVEYRTRNREIAGSTHTRSTASNLEQVANLLCAQANSASYPQRDGK